MMCQQIRRENINPVVITFGFLYIFELLLVEGLAVSAVVVKAVVVALFILVVTIGVYFE